MTTPAEELITWLRAVYDERERTALAAGGRGPAGQWHTPDDTWAGRVEDAAGNIVVYDEGSPTEAQAAHIADNDPAQVVAEVDAKRRILDRLEPFAAFDMDPVKAQSASREEWIVVTAARDAIKLLALPFADRPGYREEWGPQ